MSEISLAVGVSSKAWLNKRYTQQQHQQVWNIMNDMIFSKITNSNRSFDHRLETSPLYLLLPLTFV